MTALPLRPLPQTHTRTHRRAPYLASSATLGSSPRGWPCGCSGAWGCRTRRVLSRRRGRGGRVWHTLRCSPGGGGRESIQQDGWQCGEGHSRPSWPPVHTNTHTHILPPRWEARREDRAASRGRCCLGRPARPHAPQSAQARGLGGERGPHGGSLTQVQGGEWGSRRLGTPAGAGAHPPLERRAPPLGRGVVVWRAP